VSAQELICTRAGLTDPFGSEFAPHWHLTTAPGPAQALHPGTTNQIAPIQPE